MKKVCIMALLCTQFLGCASRTMSEGAYQTLGGLKGAATRCFEEEHMSTKTYSETMDAISYSLSVYDNFDRNKLLVITDESYAGVVVSKSNCRLVEAEAYRVISIAKEHNSNRPVYCNTYGSTTVCN